MRVLILGGTGMLGHRLWLAASERFETFATLRAGFDPSVAFAVPNKGAAIENVSADDLDTVIRALDAVRPDAVVNCIGIVKLHAEAADPVRSIMVNALFPHQLARLCGERAARLIHISTDCVFSGTRGRYMETNVADPIDLYGRTKLLGEVEGEQRLTLRTSMIGRELKTAYGLLEWFILQRGKTVRGFRRAVFSGLTTPALSRIICDVIERHPRLHGIYHVASESISKLELLRLIDEALHLHVEIESDDTLAIDRSLNADRFFQATGLTVPSWPQMVGELAEDPTPYPAARC